jgi:hypothetical protein
MPDLGMRSALFFEARTNFGPRRFKKSLGPALSARLIQMIPALGLEIIQNSRRHQFHSGGLRDCACVPDFRSIAAAAPTSTLL